MINTEYLAEIRKIEGIIGPADFFETKDVGKHLGISPSLVSVWVRNGFLKLKKKPLRKHKIRISRKEYIDFIMEKGYQEYLSNLNCSFKIKELCELTKTDRRWWQKKIKQEKIQAIKSPIKDYFLSYPEVVRVIKDILPTRNVDTEVAKRVFQAYEMKVNKAVNRYENAAQADLSRIYRSINGNNRNVEAFSNSELHIPDKTQVISDKPIKLRESASEEELFDQFKAEEENFEEVMREVNSEEEIEKIVEHSEPIQNVPEREQFHKKTECDTIISEKDNKKITFKMESSANIIRNTCMLLAQNLISKIINIPIDDFDLNTGVAVIEFLLDLDYQMNSFMKDLIELINDENEEEKN